MNERTNGTKEEKEEAGEKEKDKDELEEDNVLGFYSGLPTTNTNRK